MNWFFFILIRLILSNRLFLIPNFILVFLVYNFQMQGRNRESRVTGKIEPVRKRGRIQNQYWRSLIISVVMTNLTNVMDESPIWEKLWYLKKRWITNLVSGTFLDIFDVNLFFCKLISILYCIELDYLSLIININYLDILSFKFIIINMIIII